MSWFFLTIISTVAYASAEIIGKYISDDKSEPVYVGVTAAFFTAIVTFLFALAQKLSFPAQTAAYLGLLASAVFVAAGIITYYQGLKHSDVSEFGLLSRSRALLVVMGGVLIFRERFTLLQLFGSALVLYGVFLLTWQGGRLRLGKGGRYALVTAVLFTFGSLFDKAVIPYFTASTYTFLNYLLTVLFLLPVAALKFKHGAKFPERKTVAWLFGAGLLYGVSAYCIYEAYLASGPISLVTLVSQLEIPITVLWGIAALKEHRNMLPKLASMALLVAGILLLR